MMSALDGGSGPPENVGETRVISSYAAAKAALVDLRLCVPADLGPGHADRMTATNPAVERGAQLRGLWMWGCRSGRREIYHKVAATAIGRHPVDRLAPYVAARAGELLVAAHEHEHFDLVENFARPLVRDSVMELFGVPPPARSALEAQVGGMAGFIPGSRQSLSVGYFAIAATAGQLADLWQRPLPSLADSSRILRDAVETGTLSLDEALAQATLLLFGNSYTTLDALTGLLARLAGQPELWRTASAEPAAVPALVEEGLRLGPPKNLILFRDAIGEVECGGQVIPAGARVALPLDRINRDPDRFADPDVFDPQRSGAPHLMFGAGRHMCVGLHLARAVIRAGLVALLERMPEWPYDVRPVEASGALGGPTLVNLFIPGGALHRC